MNEEDEHLVVLPSITIIMKRLILFSLAIMGILNSCSDKKTVTDSEGRPHLSPDILENPATASGSKDEKKLPVFKFNESNHDFGTISSGEVKTVEFTFTNTGNADLVISQVTGSCGCTVAKYSKELIKQGDNGSINVTFNSNGISGQVAKTVTVLANTIPSTKVLTISAEVLKK